MKIIGVLLFLLGIFLFVKGVQIFKKNKIGDAGGVGGIVLASFALIFGLTFTLSGLSVFGFSIFF